MVSRGLKLPLKYFIAVKKVIDTSTNVMQIAAWHLFISLFKFLKHADSMASRCKIKLMIQISSLVGHKPILSVKC